jgi:hypothetical protein
LDRSGGGDPNQPPAKGAASAELHGVSDRRSTVARAISLCTGIQLAGYALLVPASYALARIVPFRLRMDEEIAYFEAVLGTLGFLPAGWLAAARGWLTAEVPYGRRFKVPFLRPRKTSYGK